LLRGAFFAFWPEKGRELGAKSRIFPLKKILESLEKVEKEHLIA
jgi:hypothetical protein